VCDSMIAEQMAEGVGFEPTVKEENPFSSNYFLLGAPVFVAENPASLPLPAYIHKEAVPVLADASIHWEIISARV